MTYSLAYITKSAKEAVKGKAHLHFELLDDVGHRWFERVTQSTAAKTCSGSSLLSDSESVALLHPVPLLCCCVVVSYIRGAAVCMCTVTSHFIWYTCAILIQSIRSSSTYIYF